MQKTVSFCQEVVSISIQLVPGFFPFFPFWKIAESSAGKDKKRKAKYEEKNNAWLLSLL